MQFSDLGLSPDVLSAVADKGYATPTPIQQQAIPVVLMGRDVLGCAQTGTGKTAGFVLPMLDILSSGRARARMPRSLIIEPTRELATQVAESFELYGKNQKLSMALLIGGESFADQEKALERGVDVLIATPGRLLDLFERGRIILADTKILVIDEADRMLDMGFIPDVERIVSLLPKLRQTLFFSATMPPEIRRLADAFLSNPKEITVAPPASPAETVTQGLVVVETEEKRDMLRRLIRHEDVKNAIIFCNRKRDVDTLWKSLKRHGFDAVALHGDMPQSARTETLAKFKAGEVRLLVASDVAARGLDIQGLSHVFNFDVPIHAEDYVHRIGRTGRAGRPGRAFTIAAPEDGRFVQSIEQLIKKAIPRLELEGVEQHELVFDDRRRRRGARKDEHRAEAKPRRDRHERKEPREGHREKRTAKAEERREAPTEQRGGRERRPERKPDRPASGPVRMENVDIDNVRQLPVRRGERHQDERDDDGRVVGFGDHMPAFLARPARAAGGRG
jgi:superfamily II DNA/RNA helicase